MRPPGLAAQIAPGKSSVYYPPTRTGMRGSHPGSYEVAHALAWSGQKPARYRKLGEHYDLVIVGAGLSGLAAAWFYRKKMGPEAVGGNWTGFMLGVGDYESAGRSRAVIATVFSLIVVSIVMSSFLILGVKAGHPDATIRTAKDALLWSTTAMFGAEPSYFGDHRPVTMGGRMIAIWLVIVSLGLIGSLAGVISAWIEDETPDQKTFSPGASEQ